MIYANKTFKASFYENLGVKGFYLCEKGISGNFLFIPSPINIVPGMNKSLTVVENKTGEPEIVEKYDPEIFLLISTFKCDELGFGSVNIFDSSKSKIIAEGWGSDTVHDEPYRVDSRDCLDVKDFIYLGIDGWTEVLIKTTIPNYIKIQHSGLRGNVWFWEVTKKGIKKYSHRTLKMYLKNLQTKGLKYPEWVDKSGEPKIFNGRKGEPKIFNGRKGEK